MRKIDGWVTAPQGFLAAGVKAGIKASGNHDVAVIIALFLQLAVQCLLKIKCVLLPYL
jgi:glutamate N-acetyltransferase/amino-acid N-acetyltransferase